jgi:hypothetical protein
MQRTRLAACAPLAFAAAVVAGATLATAGRADAQTPAPRRTTAPATAPSSVRFALAGGLSLPAGDLGADADLGVALGARAEGQLRDPRWGLRGDLSWDRYDGHTAVSSFSYVALTGNLVHHGSSGRVYQFGGLGVYNSHLRFVNGADRSNTNLGMQAGVGLALTRGSPGWFTEFGLTSAFTSGRSSVWFPVRAGFWF